VQSLSTKIPVQQTFPATELVIVSASASYQSQTKYSIKESEMKRKFVVKDVYDLSDAEAIFVHNDGAFAMAAKKAGAYEQIRLIAKVNDLADSTRREDNNRLFEKPQHVFTEAQIRARLEFSLEQCRGFYINPTEGSKSTLATMKKDEPEKYARLRTAAVSFDVIPESASVVDHRHPNHTRKVSDDDGKFPLAADLAQEYALPVGYRITADELGKLSEIYAEVQQAKTLEK